MRYFSVLDQDNVVINNIVAESLEVAQEITNAVCIEYHMPSIGDKYIDGHFISQNQ